MKLRVFGLFSWLALTAALALRGAGDGGDVIELQARLISPRDVRLDWTGTVSGAVGFIVEWRSAPTSPYIKLGYLPPDRRSFVHPRLMPGTACYYRVRAIHGPVSAEAVFNVAATLSDDAYRRAYARPEDYTWAAPKTIPTGTVAEAKSIRRDETAAAGAPVSLTITAMPVTVSGFRLTWVDRASDAEGNLLEIKPAGASDFHVCAVVGPKVNAFGWALAPPMRTARFRIRAFYFGSSSNVVQLVTGPGSTRYATSRTTRAGADAKP